MKNLIRITMIALFSGLILNSASAQEQKKQQKKQRPTREQLAETQARHIADDMAFDDATSKKFIETFCRCQKEIWALGPQRDGRPRHGKPQADEQPQTDAQAEQAIKRRFEHSQKLLDIREKYYAEYSKFLTQKQIQRVYQLEKQMMSRLSKRGGKRPGKPGQPQKHAASPAR